MLINIFISYKSDDEAWAKIIYEHLNKTVTAYLDKFDIHLYSAGDDLGDYFRIQIGRCTHLMAIVSEDTKESWWVPYEIGIASEKQYPISTFAIDHTTLPQYLQKWPYLQNFPHDIDTYIRIAMATQPRILLEGLEKIASAQRAIYTKDFHSSLKKALGQ